MDDTAVTRRGYGTDVVVHCIDEADDVSVTHPIVNLHLEDKLVVGLVDEAEVMNDSLHRHNPGIPNHLSPPGIYVVDQQVQIERVPWYFEVIQRKDSAVSVAFSLISNESQGRQG